MSGRRAPVATLRERRVRATQGPGGAGASDLGPAPAAGPVPTFCNSTIINASRPCILPFMYRGKSTYLTIQIQKNTVDDKCFIHICPCLPEITRPIHFSYRSSTPGSPDHRYIPFLLWSYTHISTQDPSSFSLVCPPQRHRLYHWR